MPKSPVTIGEYTFASKKEATKLYSSILNAKDVEEHLEGEEFEYVMALLLNHPQVTHKIGCGVKAIKVGQGHYAKTRCFHVVRVDGSVEDFSIGKCINGDHTPFHKFCIACRKTVEHDIRAFKALYFKKHGDSASRVRCAITGEKISYEEAHADHREPFTFSAIVHFFIQAHHIDLSAVNYLVEGKYGNELADSALTEKFTEWHRNNAKLRIVKARSNLGEAYLGRITSTKADSMLP